MSYTKFINFSKVFFQLDEKVMEPSTNNNIRDDSISSWNSTNNDQGLNVQTPAYVNQAHISTYYQDNPWSTIEFSKKFDVSTLGGEINSLLPPGHKPGNIQKVNN